jgi:hypothetical protein
MADGRFSYSPIHLTFLAALTFLASQDHAHAQSAGWDYQPYRIRAIVALDLPGGIAEQTADTLPTYLERRVVAAIGPVWSFNVELAASTVRQHILTDFATLPDAPPTDFPLGDIDKLVFVAVHWRPDGYSLTAREYDTFVQRWGTPIRRETRQDETLSEQVFAILCQTVAPLAQFELAADEEKHVVLKPRGVALMQIDTGEPWTRPGEVFLPIFRRTTRGGQLVEKGIQVVPWTFLQVVEGEDQNTVAQILSGTRRPFGIRRQGRVEQVAIALRSDPGDTVLKIRSRVTADKPLVGREVYAQPDPEKSNKLVRIGSTDRDGKLEVPPAKNRVRILLIKNGDHLLARLPVVPGAQPEVDVPLPDDDARLAAETLLASMREDLIDVVARRNILMARVRQKIKAKDFDAAQKLLGEINELPGHTQFNLEITTAARRMRSADPQIQSRIDQLFQGTQAALTQYLDLRPISELNNELRAAQQKGT